MQRRERREKEEGKESVLIEKEGIEIERKGEERRKTKANEKETG